MSSLYIPKGYTPSLDVYGTQEAISFIKEDFQARLAAALSLRRVSAPLFVTHGSGLNDNLSGKERAVTFDIPDAGKTAEIVHSLAKWKRVALRDYNFSTGYGLYTDMNAIRRDEELDNIHSVYVDQWDWEKIITDTDRTRSYLIGVAEAIVGAICDTSAALKERFPALAPNIKKEVFAITSEELLLLYPHLDAKAREYEITKRHGTVLIIGIGGKLSDGTVHDTRAPDYDDWELNGDIIIYHPTLDCALEISSMGIRVNKESLVRQLRAAGCEGRSALPFHRELLEGRLPLTVGGGIGQSRLCMLMMGCAHIGEVQVSVWDDETKRLCREGGIPLL